MKSIVLLIFLLAGCLPQEKVTQCGSNEAFDATKRRCVQTRAVSDTTNIASISPLNSYTLGPSDSSITHSITVSDPFDNGFTVKWFLTFPNGNTILFGTGTSVVLNPTNFAAGAYVLEVQLFDVTGNTNIDSRSWSINLRDEETPSIAPITSSPFSTRMTSSPTNISANISNSDGISNINYQWFVNGAAVAGESGTFSSSSTALDFDFDPRSTASYYIGAGSYTVTLQLTEDISNFQYDSFTWSIQNNLPEFATASVAGTTPLSGSSITVIDEVEITNNGFFNSSGANVDFCVQVDSIDGVDNNGVFVDFKIDGNNIASATEIQISSASTAFCLSDENDFSYDIATQISELHDLEAVVYDKYTGTSDKPDYNGFTEISRFKWFLNVRAKNTNPTIVIDSANTTLPCGSSTTTTGTACTITQDTPFQIAITVSDDDYDPADFSGGGDFEKFRVEFFLENELLDNSASLSSSDCFHDFTQTNNSTRYICTLTINSYDTEGPINADLQSYSVYAQVTDEDSPFITPDNRTSNTVNWTINTVNPSNTAPVLNAFAQDNGSTPAGDDGQSYLAFQASPATAIDLDGGSVDENDTIQFFVSVSDAQRDSHTIRVDRCADVNCDTVSVPSIVSTTVTADSDDNPVRTALNYMIPESTVTGTNQASVFYRITVTELSTEDGSAVNTDSEVITVLINNNNPDPQFDSNNFDPAQPANLIAFPGFPITIDPVAITDASVSDGDEIVYQWMINTGGGYEPISGADQRVLVWTPGAEIDFANQTGTGVSIKLCIGDDGVDSAGADKDPMNGAGNDCNNALLDTGDWDLAVYSNMFEADGNGGIITDHTPEGEAAIWVDTSQADRIVTYTAYSATNKQIVVEKSVVFTNSAFTAQRTGSIANAEELFSVSFSSTTSGSAPANITNLSIAGDTNSDSLYIAYMADISSVDQVHIRRIDISGGKLGLNDDGKFDFSYTGLDAGVTVNGDWTKAVVGDELTITANDFTAGDVQFNLHGSSVTFEFGTDFCTAGSPCASAGDMAAQLADLINNSTSAVLQGFTADVNVNQITLEGVEQNDFLEADIEATDIGKIVVNSVANRWQLPIIDGGLSGASKFTVRMFQGTLGLNLSSSGATKNNINATIQAEEIDNVLGPDGRMLIAVKSFTNGNIGLYELDNGSTTIEETDLDVFGDSNISNIRITAGNNTTNNDNAFLIGYNNDGRLAYARYSVDADGYDIAGGNPTLSLDLDAGFDLADSANLQFFDIAPGVLDNQLFIAVLDTNDDAYLLEVKNSSPIINCNYDGSSNADISRCTKIRSRTTSSLSQLPIVLHGPIEDVIIGDAAATTNENINSILLVGFHEDTSGADELIQGILNIDAATFTADETSSGGVYQTPYVAP